MIDPNLIATYDTIINTINAIGTVGLLVLMIAAFYTGRIVSRPIMERMIAEQHKQTELLAEQLKDSIKDALKEVLAEHTANNRRGGY